VSEWYEEEKVESYSWREMCRLGMENPLGGRGRKDVASSPGCGV